MNVKRDISLASEQVESETSTTKLILAWTPIFTREFLIYKNGKPVPSRDAFQMCPVYKDCEWTLDRSKINRSDALVFHYFPTDFKLDDLPPHRKENQLWTYVNLEPPARFQGEIASSSRRVSLW